ncbi:9497_t:CDS:2 [Funneliformis caledonium]|uniref:9497_t:CDS:1 n=1 Tax=Funneliformis caledonium TaxID=1117310 RepID=A0A9N8VGU2_9GLOM|nr:9497_t:CDS:2 [Funneliformis caledonium]
MLKFCKFYISCIDSFYGFFYAVALKGGLFAKSFRLKLELPNIHKFYFQFSSEVYSKSPFTH